MMVKAWHMVGLGGAALLIFLLSRRAEAIETVPLPATSSFNVCGGGQITPAVSPATGQLSALPFPRAELLARQPLRR